MKLKMSQTTAMQMGLATSFFTVTHVWKSQQEVPSPLQHCPQWQLQQPQHPPQPELQWQQHICRQVAHSAPHDTSETAGVVIP